VLIEKYTSTLSVSVRYAAGRITLRKGASYKITRRLTMTKYPGENPKWDNVFENFNIKFSLLTRP
jgi:hypothetical protein